MKKLLFIEKVDYNIVEKEVDPAVAVEQSSVLYFFCESCET